MDRLFKDLWDNIQGYYMDLIALLPKLFVAAVVFLVCWFIAQRIQKAVRQYLQGRMDDPLLARFLARMVKTIIIIITFLVILKIIGLGGAALSLLAGAGVGAFIIGFAFKDIGENFLAGIMLAFNRPFRVGDVVELNGIKGSVITLNLRHTQIKSFDGKDIFIPNGSVVKNPVVNYTIDGYLRYDFSIGLDYGEDIERARTIILDTLDQVNGILKEDKVPAVAVGDLGANTLNLNVYYWIDTSDDSVSSGQVKTEAIRRVLQALSEADFYLPGNILEIKNYRESALKAS